MLFISSLADDELDLLVSISQRIVEAAGERRRDESHIVAQWYRHLRFRFEGVVVLVLAVFGLGSEQVQAALPALRILEPGQLGFASDTFFRQQTEVARLLVVQVCVVSVIWFFLARGNVKLRLYSSPLTLVQGLKL